METAQHDSPFMGPRPFERADADLFFGRTREVRELLSLVIAYRTVLVYAESGAGKSSLLNAALVPALEEQEGFEVLPVTRVSGIKADAAVASTPRNVFAFNAVSHWVDSPSDTREVGASTIGAQRARWTVDAPGGKAKAGSIALPRQYTELSLAEFLSGRPHAIGRDGDPTPRAIIFDQFEELFTLHPEHWRHREAFLEQVAQALEEDDLLRVVFAMREEYLAEFDRYLSVLPRRLARFRLERLGFEGALAAVKGPVSKTARSLAPGVAERLVRELLKFRVEVGAEASVEVEGEFVEPVQLQVVCRTLWSGLPPDVTVIQQDHVKELGNVDEVLARFYSQAISSAAEKANVPERELRVWFERQFITRGGTRSTVYATRLFTAGMPNSVIDELEARHLIRADWRAGARWYELTHDRLIGPIRASNRAALYEPVDHDAEADARRRANEALARAEAAWLESLDDEVRTNQEAAIQIYDGLGDRSAVANTLMRMAELHFRSEDLGRARELASEAQGIYEELGDELGIADALRAMGRVDIRHGKETDAIPLLSEAIRIYDSHNQAPGAGWTRLLIAEALELEGGAEQATEIAKVALEQFKTIGERAGAAASLAMLGSLYLGSRKLDDALRSYGAARQIHWELADLVGASTMLSQMGYVLCELDQYDQAIARFTEAIRLSPDDVSLYVARGNAYWFAEQYDDAVADYERVLGRVGDDAWAYLGRGNSLVEVSKFGLALADFGRAMALTNGGAVEAVARRGRGLALGLLRQFQQAMDEFLASLALAPDDGFTFFSRARVLHRMGEDAKARDDLRRALDAKEPRLSGPKRSRAAALLNDAGAWD